MRRQASVGMWLVVGVPFFFVAKRSALCVSAVRLCFRQTYGPSVQVNTCGNPHERTSCSDSRCDFAVIVDAVVQKVVMGSWLDSQSPSQESQEKGRRINFRPVPCPAKASFKEGTKAKQNSNNTISFLIYS